MTNKPNVIPKSVFLDRTSPPHLFTLTLMAGVGALSLNVFLPSLPSMAEHFGVDYSLMQLSVSLYLAMTAIVQLAIGPLSDRYGRRPIVIVTVLIFIVASLAAIFAPTYGVFLACRLLQTSIATGFAMSRAIVRDMVPQEQAASMIGYVTMGMSVVPMIGPAIGGSLDAVFGWQGSFWVLAGSGVVLLVLVILDQGETFTRREGGFAQQVREYPALLKSKRFWGYCLAAAFATGAFFAYLGGAPFIGSDVFEMDAATLGFYFGSPAIGYLVGNWISARCSVRIGINQMVLYGTLVTVTGMACLLLLDLIGLHTPAVFFGCMISIGLGNGILLPNANAGMLSVRPHLAGSASGLGGAFMVGGGGALSAISSFILKPGSGALPLIILMLLTTMAATLCAVWVIWQSKAAVKQ